MPEPAPVRANGRTPTRLISPLADFLRTEAAGGALVIVAAIAALVWANLAPDSYQSLWHRPAGLTVGTWGLELDLRHWVNEGLMTAFFLVVGLEIKRELTDGELHDPRRAALPLVSAIGGMAVPAIIYAAINAGRNTVGGWAIPMATDIAMAIGVLALLGRRTPSGLKLFLLALAIIDDIGSVAVIAIFYGDGLSSTWLAWSVASVLLVVGIKRAGEQRVSVFAVAGAVLWYCLYRTGVHPTLAGVVCGLLAPSKPFVAPELIDETVLADVSSFDAAYETVRLARQSVSVVEWLEHRLVPWTSYVVVPMFALANAGIPVSIGAIRDAASSPVALGVVVGLVVGKPLGIVLCAWLGLRLGGLALPAGCSWGHLVGAAALAGIGFTVSLFIADLAFDASAPADAARLGVVAATLLAALLGSSLLLRAAPTVTTQPTAADTGSNAGA